MRRLLFVVVVAGLASAAWRQWQARKADAELWQEATAQRDLR